MTLAYGTYSTAQTNRELVPAQVGKVIRVVRLLVTTWASMKITLLSDPGPDPLNLTPPMHVGVGSPFVLALGRNFAVATARDKALGITTAFQSVSGEYSVAVWYEVVS